MVRNANECSEQAPIRSADAYERDAEWHPLSAFPKHSPLPVHERFRDKSREQYGYYMHVPIRFDLNLKSTSDSFRFMDDIVIMLRHVWMNPSHGLDSMRKMGPPSRLLPFFGREARSATRLAAAWR